MRLACLHGGTRRPAAGVHCAVFGCRKCAIYGCLEARDPALDHLPCDCRRARRGPGKGRTRNARPRAPPARCLRLCCTTPWPSTIWRGRWSARTPSAGAARWRGESRRRPDAGRQRTNALGTNRARLAPRLKMQICILSRGVGAQRGRRLIQQRAATPLQRAATPLQRAATRKGCASTGWAGQWCAIE